MTMFSFQGQRIVEISEGKDLHPFSHGAHAKVRDQASSGRHDRQEDLIAVYSATVGRMIILRIMKDLNQRLDRSLTKQTCSHSATRPREAATSCRSQSRKR